MSTYQPAAKLHAPSWLAFACQAHIVSGSSLTNVVMMFTACLLASAENVSKKSEGVCVCATFLSTIIITRVTSE